MSYRPIIIKAPIAYVIAVLVASPILFLVLHLAATEIRSLSGASEAQELSRFINELRLSPKTIPPKGITFAHTGSGWTLSGSFDSASECEGFGKAFVSASEVEAQKTDLTVAGFAVRPHGHEPDLTNLYIGCEIEDPSARSYIVSM